MLQYQGKPGFQQILWRQFLHKLFTAIHMSQSSFFCHHTFQVFPTLLTKECSLQKSVTAHRNFNCIPTQRLTGSKDIRQWMFLDAAFTMRNVAKPRNPSYVGSYVCLRMCNDISRQPPRNIVCNFLSVCESAYKCLHAKLTIGLHSVYIVISSFWYNNI